MVGRSGVQLKAEKEFQWYEGLAICLSMIGVQLCSEVINQWGLYFYSPSGGVGRTVYVSIYWVGYIFIIGTVWDAISSPMVGALSDKTPTQPGRWRIVPIHGRRRPYIFFGSLLMVGTMIGFWFPPIGHVSIVNFFYGMVILCAHWTLFSVAVIPLNALGPEIARSENARIALGTWTAVGMIVGLALANALPGVLITVLDPARVESHLELTFESEGNRVDAEINQCLTLWQLTEKEVQGKIRKARSIVEENREMWKVFIEGEALKKIKEGVVLRTFDGIFRELGIDSYQRLPRKAYLAFHVRSDKLTFEKVGQFKEKLVGIILPYIGILLNEQINSSKNCISFTSPTIERIREEDLIQRKNTSASFWKNKQFRCQGETLEVIKSDDQWKPMEIQRLHEEITDIIVDRNLIITSSETKKTLILSKGLFFALALSRVKDSVSNSSVRDVRWVSESYSPAGYRRVATVFALVSFLLFLLPVILIRERYDSTAIQSEPLPWGQGLKDAFRNKPFLIYAWSFFLFTIGFLAVQRVLPYWAELGLDGDESTITLLLIPFILVAMISYAVIPVVAKYIHMKWLMCIALGIIASGMPFLYVIGKVDVDFSIRTIFGMILFGYCGIGQAIIYVMMIPMLGDIIDYDEKCSGERREAIYNGLSAFIWKASMAGSIWLASQSMSYWGNSIEDYTGVLLVGPFAGLFGLLGMVLISFYPTKWREKDGCPSGDFPE